MQSISLKYKDIAEKRLEFYKNVQPDVFTLAMLASLARKVEPELLRSLRLNLSHYFEDGNRPHVGTESGLWFSSLIESRGVESITLLPRVLKILRHSLKQNSDLLEEVYAITKCVHQNVPPIIGWEENLTYFGLSSKLSETQRTNLIYKTTLEAVKAIKGGDRNSLGEIVLDISRRIPSTVIKQEGFIKLIALSQAELLKYKIDGKNQQQNPQTSLFIKCHKNHLEIGEKIEGAEFKITVPKIMPLMINVSFQQSKPSSYLIPETVALNIPIPAWQNLILIHTLDGNVYKIDKSDLIIRNEGDFEEASIISNIQKTNNRFPKSLREALKAGKVVPVVGAGVSISVKKRDDITESSESLFPSWKGFIEQLAQILRDEGKTHEANYVLSNINIRHPKYLDALHYGHNEIGDTLWYKLIDDNFDIPFNTARPNSLRLSRLIWELSNNLIITTNFDRTLQWTCPEPSEFRAIDLQNSQHAKLKIEEFPKSPTVWYLHGHIDHKEKIIFTREQFESFYKRRDNEVKLRPLLNFLVQRTLLFVGFSTEDPYLHELIEYINQIYKNRTDSIYILLHEHEIEKANLPESVTIISFPDFGQQFENLVEDLVHIKNPDLVIDLDPPNDFGFANAFFNVPYRSKGKEFIGRIGKMEEIWNRLNQDQTAAIGQAVSIKGFGGLGKTQLAVEYAQAYRDKYKNGVFWITADESFDTQLLRIAEEQDWINVYDKTVNHLEIAKVKFLALSECLVIFDNVENYIDIKDYQPKTNRQTHILITTRESIPGFHQISLDLLEREESRVLLLKVSGRSIQSETEKYHLESILEILGDIPLAVELVGGYLAENEIISFEKYNQYLEEVPLDHLEKEFLESSFTNHDRSIIQTLRISEKTFREKPLMVEILKLLAWSGKSSMGISLLQSLIEPKNDFEFISALSDAHRLRLLYKEVDAERYSIHRLIAKVIRYEQPFERQYDWLHKIIFNLKKWFTERRNEFTYLAEFETEIEHLREWRKYTAQILSSHAPGLIALESSPFLHRGSYQKALKLLSDAFDLYQTEKLDDLDLLAKLHNDLGIIYGKLANHQKALEHQSTALEIHHRLFGRNHLDTAITLSNIAVSHDYLGNSEKAINYQQEALEIMKGLLPDRSPQIAKLMIDLGGSYKSKGETKRAHKYFNDALQIHQAMSETKHPDIALSHRMLGETYYDIKDYQQALSHLEQALKLQQELFGSKHPDIADTLHSIAITYVGLGNKKKANELFEKAFEMFESFLGKSHPHTISACSNLISVLLETGYAEKAGRLAGEFLSYIPQNHPRRKFFEQYGQIYRKAKTKKRRRN